MTTLIVIGSIFAYFAVGWLLAVKDMPQAWERARKSWSSPDNQRTSAHVAAAMTFLLWPFRWPFVALINTSDRRDPLEIERQVAEQKRRIDDLERELRIGRRS